MSFHSGVLVAVVGNLCVSVGVMVFLTWMWLKQGAAQSLVSYAYELVFVALYVRHIAVWPVEPTGSLPNTVYWLAVLSSTLLVLVPAVRPFVAMCQSKRKAAARSSGKRAVIVMIALIIMVTGLRVALHYRMLMLYIDIVLHS